MSIEYDKIIKKNMEVDFKPVRTEGEWDYALGKIKVDGLEREKEVMGKLADIQDRGILSCMEAGYTSIRLAELVTGESVSRFDFS